MADLNTRSRRPTTTVSAGIRRTAVVTAAMLVAAACTPASTTAPPATAQEDATPAPASTTPPGTGAQPEAAPSAPPDPLLELGDVAPLLVAPGDLVPVGEDSDRVELVSADGRADAEVVDGAVRVPADAEGELLLVERRGDTLVPRVLYVAEGPGVWVVPDHTELIPGDVALVWILHRDLPTSEVLLMAGDLEGEPRGFVASGGVFLTVGYPEPIDLEALNGGPFVLTREAAEALDEAGVSGVTVLTEAGVYPQEVSFEACDTPGTVEGNLGNAGRVRAVSLSPAGRSGALATSDGGFRFLAPPGPVVVTGVADDGTPLRATGRAVCGKTATVGDAPTGEPESLDLARVRVDLLGRAEPDRACRTATVAGSEASSAALELDRLSRLDVLTVDDVERAVAAVADGVLRPMELVVGLASRWSPGGLAAVAEADGTTVFDGETGLSGDPAELVTAVAATSLCPTAGVAIGEPGATVSLPVRVTDLAGDGQRASVEVVDAADGTVLGVADTDDDGSVTVAWTAPDEPVVQTLAVTANLPASGAAPTRRGFLASAAPSIPATGATGSTAYVGGVWQLVGSNWATFSDETLLSGLSFGAALLACTSGPRLRGPWHGVVWIATGGVLTLGLAGVGLATAIGATNPTDLIGAMFGTGNFLALDPDILGTEVLRATYYGHFVTDLLLTGNPPRSLGPKDGATIEVFPIPFEDAEIVPGGEPKVVSRDPFPLVSLTEVTRPRLSAGPAGTIVFGSPATGTARLFNEGGTVTHARFFWAPSCGLDAETFEQAKRDFDMLQGASGG